jgi:hypothetical protein
MKRLLKLPSEFTLAQWIRRPKLLARKVLVCDCWKERISGDAQRFGFLCRGPGSCGRYCCACVGGSELGAQNLCSDCYMRRERKRKAGGKG